jgi:hypothetical protein
MWGLRLQVKLYRNQCEVPLGSPSMEFTFSNNSGDMVTAVVVLAKCSAFSLLIASFELVARSVTLAMVKISKNLKNRPSKEWWVE